MHHSGISIYGLSSRSKEHKHASYTCGRGICHAVITTVLFEQQERFRTYCTVLHMRLCMPLSSTFGAGVVSWSGPSAGGTEKQTQDSEPPASRLRASSSSSAADAKRSASDRYSYRAAISAHADD